MKTPLRYQSNGIRFSQELIPTTKNNQCPVCGDVSGKCRQGTQDKVWFCAGHPDTRKFEVVGNFKCISHSICGFWGIFKPDDSQEWNEARREEWRQQNEAREREAKEQQLEAQSRALSSEERDKHYCAILDGLKLDAATVSDLRRRGFTDDEIKNSGFKSANSYQKLNRKYPLELPGIGDSGDYLVVSGDGYLCPVRDFEGRKTALQLRLHNSNDGGRYRWLSTPQTATLKLQPEDELPLSVHHPKEKPVGIAICEGTGSKPYFISQRLNYLVIGAAGGQWLSSPKLLEKYINQALNKYGKLPIVLFPDAGFEENKLVHKKCNNLINWLREKFSDEITKIAYWQQESKANSKDIDELQDNIKIKLIDNFGDSKQDLNDDWKWEKWLRSRKFTADTTVHQKEFNIENIPNSNVIVAANSGLGTGKTNFLIRQLKQSRLLGKGSLIIGYRNNLLLQTSERALQDKVPIYHLHQDEDARALVADDSSNIALCLDSIHHVEGYFKGKDIYLDETVSVLLHAVNGGTLGDKQARALRIFKQALIECDRIFLLDGNLSNLYVDFIARIAGNKRVIKVKNTQKIPPHKITFIDGIDEDGEIKKRDRSPLINFLLKPEVKPWIFCDSKERTKVIYKLLTDLGRKGYVLNSETTGEDWGKEFLANPDKFIADTKPDFMILSPSGDSGISVTVGNHFTHKFSFFSGVLGTNSQHQSMFRLRDDGIPHYVFCPQISTVRNRSTPKNYSVNRLKEVLDNRIVQSALLASECSSDPQKAIEIISQALSRNDTDWHGLSLELTGLDNFEMDNLRECLIHALKEAGHNIEVTQWETVEQAKESEKEAKEEIQKIHSQEVFDAVPFNSIEEANHKAKNSPNKDTQRKIEKTRLLDRLPRIEHSSVWSQEFIYNCTKKHRDFMRQQERYWLLKNFEVSEKRHEASWNFLTTQEDFFSRSASMMSHDVIWALKELNILELIESNKEYHKDSPEITRLINLLRSRNDIQLALRLNQLEPQTQEGKERIRILNQLLNLIGFKSQFIARNRRKIGTKTVRAREYQIVPIGSLKHVPTPPHIYKEAKGCGTPPETMPDKEYSDYGETEQTRGKLQDAQSTEIPSEWYKPENIADVTQMLTLCDSSESLELLRKCDIPPEIFKAASRKLPKDKRDEIRQWVLESA